MFPNAPVPPQHPESREATQELLFARLDILSKSLLGTGGAVPTTFNREADGQVERDTPLNDWPRYHDSPAVRRGRFHTHISHLPPPARRFRPSPMASPGPSPTPPSPRSWIHPHSPPPCLPLQVDRVVGCGTWMRQCPASAAPVRSVPCCVPCVRRCYLQARWSDPVGSRVDSLSYLPPHPGASRQCHACHRCCSWLCAVWSGRTCSGRAIAVPAPDYAYAGRFVIAACLSGENM